MRAGCPVRAANRSASGFDPSAEWSRDASGTLAYSKYRRDSAEQHRRRKTWILSQPLLVEGAPVDTFAEVAAMSKDEPLEAVSAADHRVSLTHETPKRGRTSRPSEVPIASPRGA